MRSQVFSTLHLIPASFGAVGWNGSIDNNSGCGSRKTAVLLEALATIFISLIRPVDLLATQLTFANTPHKHHLASIATFPNAIVPHQQYLLADTSSVPATPPEHHRNATDLEPTTMDFGKAIGVALSTFAITNIDDLFVLVTFFAEASTSSTLTPLKIVLGQYIGFTIIIAISMIGFALAFAVPTQPIGFLGLLPILVGIWRAIDLLIPLEEQQGSEHKKSAALRSVGKVAAVTLMNGGDNVGTYTPLFSQAKRGEIAVYVVVYYIMLGVWCGVAWLIMGQKHLLQLVQKYARWLLPLLYVSLGIFIIINSECYPWAVERIDRDTSTDPGAAVLSATTVVLVVLCTGTLVAYQRHKQAAQGKSEHGGAGEELGVEHGIAPARASSETIEPVDRAASKAVELEKRSTDDT